jgi:hypothetical protein
MRIMKHSRLLILLLAGSAAFGQQGTTPTKSRQTRVDVARLLTVQEVARVGGRTVKVSASDQTISFTTEEQVMGSPGYFTAPIVTLLPPLPDWDGWVRGNELVTRVSGVGGDTRQDSTKLVLALHKENRTS